MNIKSPFGRISRAVNAKEFLQITSSQRNYIKRTKFIAPRIGSSGFGHFLVEFEYGYTAQ